jgi:hypothetical protein
MYNTGGKSSDPIEHRECAPTPDMDKKYVSLYIFLTFGIKKYKMNKGCVSKVY